MCWGTRLKWTDCPDHCGQWNNTQYVPFDPDRKICPQFELTRQYYDSVLETGTRCITGSCIDHGAAIAWEPQLQQSSNPAYRSRNGQASTGGEDEKASARPDSVQPFHQAYETHQDARSPMGLGPKESLVVQSPDSNQMLSSSHRNPNEPANQANLPQASPQRQLLLGDIFGQQHRR